MKYLVSVMNAVIVHVCMIKGQVQNDGISEVIVDLQVQPIISAVDSGDIHHQEVEMIKCIIDTIDIRNDLIQRSVVLYKYFVLHKYL